MESYFWDSFLERVCQEVNNPTIRSLVLLCRLLDGRLEVVSTFLQDKGIDPLFRGVRISPPLSKEKVNPENAVLVLPIAPELAHLTYFAGVSEAGNRFLLIVLSFGPMVVAAVAEKDISTKLTEVLQKIASSNEMLRKERFKLYEQLNHRLVLDSFLFSLVTLLQAVEPYTYYHSLRVAAFAQSVALGMNLSLEIQETLRVAGLIHDLGKLFVPREILLKPGRLNREELEEVKRHVFYLDRIFLGNTFMEDYLHVARLHHERLDGSGYLGLKEEEIPFEARILVVCDVFDALLHHRPYRRAYSFEEAVKEINAMGKAGKLDAKVIEKALLSVPEYYLRKRKEEGLPLFPGIEVSVRRIRGGESFEKEIYLGRVVEVERDKIILAFDSPPSLSSEESVLISWGLSYSAFELTARLILVEGRHFTFLVKRTEERRKAFTLPWNLQIRFTKFEPGQSGKLVRLLMQNLKNLHQGETEIVGGDRMTFLTNSSSLQAGDNLVVLFEAYGERFIVPARVVKVENLGFVQRVHLEDFALPQREVDRIYGVLFRREAEIRFRVGKTSLVNTS